MFWELQHWQQLCPRIYLEARLFSSSVVLLLNLSDLLSFYVLHKRIKWIKSESIFVFGFFCCVWVCVHVYVLEGMIAFFSLLYILGWTIPDFSAFLLGLHLTHNCQVILFGICICCYSSYWKLVFKKMQEYKLFWRWTSSFLAVKYLPKKFLTNVIQISYKSSMFPLAVSYFSKFCLGGKCG